MPNPIYNNQHGSNRTQGAGADTKARGSKPSGAMPMKTANWPGLPGPAQPSRSKSGFAEEKVYAMAKGLPGGRDPDSGESKVS